MWQSRWLSINTSLSIISSFFCGNGRIFAEKEIVFLLRQKCLLFPHSIWIKYLPNVIQFNMLCIYPFFSATTNLGTNWSLFTHNQTMKLTERKMKRMVHIKWVPFKTMQAAHKLFGYYRILFSLILSPIRIVNICRHHRLGLFTWLYF